MDFDFGTSTTVDKLEKVPEQFRGLYVEKEGKHVLKSDDPAVKGAVEAILGLNKALKDERAVKRPTVDLTPLKDYGLTPEEIKAKIDELKETIASNAKVDPKKIKDEMAGQFKKDLDAKEARIGALVGKLNSLLIDSALKGAIAAEHGDIDLLLPFARQLMKPLETDGNYDVAVVDEKGNARFSGVTGQPMSPLELIREMKLQPKYGKLFESEAPRGGGVRSGTIPGRAGAQGNGREKTATEKIAAGLGARAR